MDIGTVFSYCYSKAKQHLAYGLFLTYLLGGLSVISTEPAYANPVGGTVAAGQATITDSNAQTNVQQFSDKAIINWQSFSIGAGEKTIFIQPNSNSIALNRVIGSDPSNIFGQLSANGRIILINPAGVVFGVGSRVDVAGLIATTANIRDDDFMAGQLHFIQSPDKHAAVINNGTIHIADNGLAALVAPAVQNNGVIEARLGRVTLASGNEFTVDLYGDQLINFGTHALVTEPAVDENGHPYRDAVSNQGAIYADGGKVVLTANVAKNVVDNAINMQGVIQARGVSVRNGEIILSGGNNGTVRVSGKLDVSHAVAHQRGGKVKVLGENIFLTNSARIDARGDGGGGEVLVGGNYQGKGPEMNAFSTTIEKGAVIDASAITDGNGGRVILWSDGMTDFNGSVLATGGATRGDGGFAEISGKHLLAYRGQVDLTASLGETGQLLLDPENLIIQSGGSSTTTPSGSPTNTYTSNTDSSILTVADLQNALANASVTVQTGTGGSQAGDITVANGFSWSSGNSLTLLAFRHIFLNNSTPISNTGGGSVTLRADSSGTGVGTISGTGTINLTGGGSSTFYYNPTVIGTATNFAPNITAGGLTAYMLINSATDLQNINNNLAGNYAIGKNIDASATSGWNSGRGFDPLGDITGTLEGLNHTISGLFIHSIGAPIALFSQTHGATIRNLGLTNLDFRPILPTYQTYTAGFVSFAQNTLLDNVFTSGTIRGYGFIGGLVGYGDGITITNSHNSANLVSLGNSLDSDVGSGLIGGLVARVYGTSLINHSYNTADINITGDTSMVVGGLVGLIYNSSNALIENSFNSGNIIVNTTGQASDTGGLVGYIDLSASTVRDSFNLGNIKIISSGNGNVYSIGGVIGASPFAAARMSHLYSIGNIATTSSSQQWIGALAGRAVDFTLSNSYWNTETSGQTLAVGVGSNFITVVGKTTAELMNQSTFTGWDFTSGTGIWSIIEGMSFPYHQAIFTSTPQAISGIAYSVPTSTSVGANTIVNIVTNGSVIGNTRTGANGFYYKLFNNGTFAANSPVLVYLDSSSGGGHSGNTVINLGNTANSSISGLDIYKDSLRLRMDGTSYLNNTLLGTLKGALSTSDILYSVSGSNLSLSSGKSLRAYSGNYQLDGDITANGNLTFDGAVSLSNHSTLSSGAGNILFNSTLDGPYTLTLSGNDLTFVGNVGGSSTLGSVIIDNAHDVTLGNVFNVGSFTQNAGTGTTDLGNGLYSLSNITVNTGFISGNNPHASNTLFLNGENGMLVRGIYANRLLLDGGNGGRLYGYVVSPVDSDSILSGARGDFYFNDIKLVSTNSIYMLANKLLLSQQYAWGSQMDWINQDKARAKHQRIRSNFEAIDDALARSYFDQGPFNIIIHSRNNIELMI